MITGDPIENVIREARALFQEHDDALDGNPTVRISSMSVELLRRAVDRLDTAMRLAREIGRAYAEEPETSPATETGGEGT